MGTGFSKCTEGKKAEEIDTPASYVEEKVCSNCHVNDAQNLQTHRERIWQPQEDTPPQPARNIRFFNDGEERLDYKEVSHLNQTTKKFFFYPKSQTGETVFVSTSKFPFAKPKVVTVRPEKVLESKEQVCDGHYITPVADMPTRPCYPKLDTEARVRDVAMRHVPNNVSMQQVASNNMPMHHALSNKGCTQHVPTQHVTSNNTSVQHVACNNVSIQHASCNQGHAQYLPANRNPLQHVTSNNMPMQQMSANTLPQYGEDRGWSRLNVISRQTRGPLHRTVQALRSLDHAHVQPYGRHYSYTCDSQQSSTASDFPMNRMKRPPTPLPSEWYPAVRTNDYLIASPLLARERNDWKNDNTENIHDF